MKVGLSEKKLDDLRHRLECWLPGRREAAGRGVPIAGREVAPCGVRSPAGLVLRLQASAVSKPDI